MSIAEFMQSSYPAIICAVFCLVLVFEVYKLTKKHSIPAWMRRLNASISRAANDPAYLKSELKQTEAELEKMPAPDSIREITPSHEYQLRTFPRMIFLFALFGAGCLCIGAFNNNPDLRWPIFAGWLCLIIALVLYLKVDALLPRYTRVQLLNKKYLLQKVGKQEKRFETLQELVAYYPRLSGLRIELAEQLASGGNTAKALETLRQAAENDSGNADVTLAIVSLLLREKKVKEAEETLERAEKQQRQPLDPRIFLYRGALALANGDKAKAREFAEKAVEKNDAVSRIMVDKDPALVALAAFLPGNAAE